MLGEYSMNKSKLYELSKKAEQKLNVGDYNGTLSFIRKIQNLGSDNGVGFIASALLINCGSASKDKELVIEGITLLEAHFENFLQSRLAPHAHYNLANGYSELFKFSTEKDPYFALFKTTDLNKAIFHFRRALSFDVKNSMSVSEMLVNLGNCYDSAGRVVDALDCYDKSVKHAPNHGMAVANKGLAIKNYAKLAGEHQVTYLLEAFSLIKTGLKLGVTPESVATFSKNIDEIKQLISDKTILEKTFDFPGCTIKARSNFEKSLVAFCLENGLYLNICNVCKKCNAAIGDTVIIKEMMVSIDESDKYLNLASYLNQIKQDYITARFLLFLSRYKKINLNFVDKRVTLVNTLDHSINNIYVQLVKESFKSFYNILDKIACFIRDYLGLHKKKIYFSNVWYSNKEKKTVYDKITDTKNISLNALFDINRDFERSGPYGNLRDTRNALTHRFVNIKMVQKIEDAENMTEDALITKTIELAKIVRNSIIYLLNFVHVEEMKKNERNKGLCPVLHARQIPDKQKSCR